MVIDVDGAMGPNSIYFSNLDGTSRSHTAQIDATYPFIEGFSATAAFRLNDARTTYNGELRLRPLTSRYKGLLTLSVQNADGHLALRCHRTAQWSRRIV